MSLTAGTAIRIILHSAKIVHLYPQDVTTCQQMLNEHTSMGVPARCLE
jgi:hypothetical protein